MYPLVAGKCRRRGSRSPTFSSLSRISAQKARPIVTPQSPRLDGSNHQISMDSLSHPASSLRFVPCSMHYRECLGGVLRTTEPDIRSVPSANSDRVRLILRA
jgi:hypothetical protein